MFLKVDNRKNGPNVKTRLTIETKNILRNKLNKKTDILIYLVKSFQKTISMRAIPFCIGNQNKGSCVYRENTSDS